MKPEYLVSKSFPECNVVITLWRTGRRRDNREHLKYNMRWKGKTLFSGSDYSSSPMHSIGGLDILGLLALWSLRPGDTNDDYFKDYTHEQKEWCESDDCETASLLVWDYKET